MSETDKNRLLDAALDHVVFDGWSDEAFNGAVEDTGIDAAVAKSIFPRPALDMATAFHERGDAEMVARLTRENMLSMRFRDRVAAGVRFRLEAVGEHKEAVRRGTALFALPQNAAAGAKLVWGTADAIWTTLGDSSDDFNWYSKRTILSGVYGSTVLFWLGDDREDHAATWEFLDRRIDNVMQFEKLKSQVKDHPIGSKLMAGPNWLMSKVKAPSAMPRSGLPGSIRPTK